MTFSVAKFPDATVNRLPGPYCRNQPEVIGLKLDHVWLGGGGGFTYFFNVHPWTTYSKSVGATHQITNHFEGSCKVFLGIVPSSTCYVTLPETNIVPEN